MCLFIYLKHLLVCFLKLYDCFFIVGSFFFLTIFVFMFVFINLLILNFLKGIRENKNFRLVVFNKIFLRKTIFIEKQYNNTTNENNKKITPIIIL